MSILGGAVKITFAAVACLAFANVMAVQAQDLNAGYTFVKGGTYVYRSVFDQTAVQNNGTFEDSFVHNVDMRIMVEDVDSAGKGALICTVLNQGYRRKNKGEGTTKRQLSDTLSFGPVTTIRPLDEMPSQQSVKLMANRPDVTPKFRVVLTPAGAYVSGEILEKSESQKFHEKELKKPNITGEPWNTDEVLKFEIGQFFKPLPAVKAKAFGETWSDTTFKTHEGKVYGGPGGSHFTYTREQRDFVWNIIQDPESPTSRELVEHWMKTIKSPSTSSRVISVFEFDGTIRTCFRSDGMYLGYSDVSTSVRTSMEDEDAEPVVRGNGKFVVRVTLLRDE